MSRGLVTVGLCLTLGLSVGAQGPGGEWLRPYPAAPAFWELVGRLFQDTPELRRNRGFRGFLDPSVLAAGSLKSPSREGDMVGTFVRYLAVQGNNVLNAGEPPDRLVVADVTQLRFVAAEPRVVRLDVRTGNPSSEFQRCYDGRHTQFAHLVDIRLQAAVLCEGGLFWTGWREQHVSLDDTLTGIAPFEQLGTLALTLDPQSRELRITIRALPAENAETVTR